MLSAARLPPPCSPGWWRPGPTRQSGPSRWTGTPNPPGNRAPTASETLTCLPFLERHIALARPEVLVFLGGTAAKALLDVSEGIMRLRGKWLSYALDGRQMPALATFHPAFLLRQPARKREAWRDFLTLQDWLKTRNLE